MKAGQTVPFGHSESQGGNQLPVPRLPEDMDPISGKRFSSFLSHFKREAGTEARLVQMHLGSQAEKEIFLDSGQPAMPSIVPVAPQPWSHTTCPYSL